jgi:hypothetical protein
MLCRFSSTVVPSKWTTRSAIGGQRLLNRFMDGASVRTFSLLAALHWGKLGGRVGREGNLHGIWLPFSYMSANLFLVAYDPLGFCNTAPRLRMNRQEMKRPNLKLRIPGPQSLSSHVERLLMQEARELSKRVCLTRGPICAPKEAACRQRIEACQQRSSLVEIGQPAVVAGHGQPERHFSDSPCGSRTAVNLCSPQISAGLPTSPCKCSRERERERERCRAQLTAQIQVQSQAARMGASASSI